MRKVDDKANYCKQELSETTKVVGVDALVMPTLKDIEEKREEKTIYLLISTLANMMCAKEDIIIDLLSGYLWTEEEGNKLKRSA